MLMIQIVKILKLKTLMIQILRQNLHLTWGQVHHMRIGSLEAQKPLPLVTNVQSDQDALPKVHCLCCMLQA